MLLLALALQISSCEETAPLDAQDATPSSSATIAQLAPAASASASPVVEAAGARVQIPGTGVSIVAPAGVKLAAIGSMLVDDPHELSIAAIVLPARTFRERQAMVELGYPGGPETVRFGTVPATLRHRTREQHGTGDDGWLLTIEGDPSLVVLASYQGSDRERWKALGANLRSVEWNPRALDPELALGVTPGPIPEMKLDRDGVGGLSYRAEQPETERVDLSFMAFPTVLPEGPDACSAALQRSTANAASVGKPAVMQSQAGLAGCEVTTGGPDGTESYWAIVRMPNGRGVVAARGTSPKDTFSKWRPRFAAAARALRSSR